MSVQEIPQHCVHKLESALTSQAATCVGVVRASTGIQTLHSVLVSLCFFSLFVNFLYSYLLLIYV